MPVAQKRRGVSNRSDCSVYCHSERGECSVEVRDDRTGRTVAEWSNDDLGQMIDDGFFTGGACWGYDGPRIGRDAFVGSVLDYCEEAGLVR